MTARDLERLWREAQDTVKRLESCPGPHEFVDATPERKLAKTWKCARCGGTISAANHYWYERGLRHGREAPNGGTHG